MNDMKKIKWKCMYALLLYLIIPDCTVAQDKVRAGDGESRILSSVKPEKLMLQPKCVDHFNESMPIDFLKDNQKSVLICPDQVNELLKRNANYPKVEERIHSFQSDTIFDQSISVNNINISVLRFKHGSWFETDSATGKKYDLHQGVENLGYLMDSCMSGMAMH